jgi:hypothetical protein
MFHGMIKFDILIKGDRVIVDLLGGTRIDGDIVQNQCHSKS